MKIIITTKTRNILNSKGFFRLKINVRKKKNTNMEGNVLVCNKGEFSLRLQPFGCNGRPKSKRM